MASKNKSRSKSKARKNLFSDNVKDKGLDKTGKERNTPKRNAVQLKQTVLDSMIILKQAGESLQDDISEESFNPPLHSTAVYTEDDDLPEKTNVSAEKSANRASSSVSQKKRQNSSGQKKKTAASKNRTLTPKNVPGKKLKTPQKTATSVQDLEASENGESSGPEEAEGKTGSTQQSPPAEQKSSGPSQPTVKRKKTPNKNKSIKLKQNEQIDLAFNGPEDIPATAKNVNELDVILFESGKLVERYRESRDGSSRKAVDNFFLSFKDQLSTRIQNIRLLKELKRQNTKVQLEIGRKQKRLIEIKDEIIKKQPRLHQLQKECSELEERQKSMKDAKTFLENIEQLQEDYRKHRAKNPNSKETYGLSSLPALILQAQSTHET